MLPSAVVGVDGLYLVCQLKLGRGITDAYSTLMGSIDKGGVLE